MKTFTQYIKEELEKHTVENLKVTYSANKHEIYIDCPETYQEDDIHQYIDDLLLDQMPSNQDIAEKYFRSNVKYLNDAYFEYDSFERFTYKRDTSEIKYKEELGKDVSTDIKIVSFKITNLRFKLLFSKFEVMLEENDDLEDTIHKIFGAYESNNYNTSDVRFSYDSCKYDS